MCGISGIINFKNKPVEEHTIRNMMAVMKHRGPDDDGIFSDVNVGLGFVRLSILDLSFTGHQPMYSHNRRYVIVYNGEVYNYIELRKELKHKYQFKTGTDTEVVLAAYQEWGEDCLHRFNGMFAFAIYDMKKKTLFIARDRFGIKPLYFFLDKDRFIFASEILPILTVLNRRPEPDNRSVFDYLVYNRTDQTEKTFFKDIKKLQHGHIIKIEDRKVKLEKWYDLKQRLNKPFSSPEEFKETLSSAVKLRLRSDVPVGVCLSGGVDSSSIVSLLLHDYQKDDLNTFSAIYGKGVKGDESEFIEEYRSDLKNMYFTYPDADSLYQDMFDYVRAHNEPTPSTAPYAQFKVMECAKDHVVVTLDGQGADEELAGYHYFFGYFFKGLLLRFRLLKLIQEMYHYTVLHRSSYGIQTFAYYLLPLSLKARARINEKGYISRDFAQSYKDGSAIPERLYNASNLSHALLDHFEYKLEHLLKWEDRNSMWFSLESRVPFLDHRMVEKSLSLDSGQVIHNGMTKYIMRQAMRGIVPEKIRLRKDKVGFLTPEDNWFRTDKFKNFIVDLLHSSSFKNRDYINPKNALSLYQKHLNKKVNISKEIWKWINLELWFQAFIDKEPGVQFEELCRYYNCQ